VGGGNLYGAQASAQDKERRRAQKVRAQSAGPACCVQVSYPIQVHPVKTI